MKTSLLVLAAGMGSRYGGLKQMEGIGPGGETLTDYSLYDAIRAGFNKIVFVIREEFEEDFKAKFAPKLEGKIDFDFAYQGLDSFTDGFQPDKDREKPWGTGHAVLVANDKINEPFGVINADDFYGHSSFEMLNDFLADPEKTREDQYVMVGFELKNTLSEHGSVSRGICEVDDSGNLQKVVERTKIHKENGKVVFQDKNGDKSELTGDETVSMNFWGFHPGLFDHLEKQFRTFLEKKGKELKSEFFLPSSVDELINTGRVKTRVLVSDQKWFGMTYKEDLPVARESIQKLIDQGIYPENLWK